MKSLRKQRGYIGGGLVAHTHSGGASGGGTLQHVPPGAIMQFAFGSDPTGFLECNGQNVSRTTYSDLFAVIGTTWGVGDGSTTFGLPDLRRRSTVGKGGAGTGTLGNAVGNTGGEETHTQASGELALHSHTQNSHSHSSPTGNSSNAAFTRARGDDSLSGTGNLTTGGATATNNNTGSSTPFNVYHPAAIVGFYIKY